MNKKAAGILLAFLLVIGYAGNASAFLSNWFFDIDGPGGAQAVQINGHMDILSPNLVDTALGVGGAYSFENYGVVLSNLHDGFGSYPSGNELTGAYHFSGAGTLGGPVTFNSGYFDMYVQSPGDYGTANGILGANNGTNIASFSVLSGAGFVDPTGVPNGLFTISYVANFILPGYFFMPDGVTDLALLPSANWTLGYTTTNASWVRNANLNALVKSELLDFAGMAGAANEPPIDFFLSSNGQFRIDVVPEPSTMLLLGVGLLGLAGVSRKTLRKRS